MDILIIGGTRNMGHFLALELLAAGHNLTVLNRGMTPDKLPPEIERLRADRTSAEQMQAALDGRTFGAVVDTTLYKGPEAEMMVELLAGNVGHYIFLSTGQVYLVCEGVTRPFKESDYDSPEMPQPPENTYDREEWLYGHDKRMAEDAFARAWAEQQFPYTALRLPMVNSERDHFHRLYSYILRIQDGGPILVPETPDYPLRHIYGRDVVKAVLGLIASGDGKGMAYNISQEETVTLEAFLAILGGIVGKAPHIERIERAVLDANGFLPDCSPFSDLWMSELDNQRSKDELGMTYTPLRDYLGNIVAHYQANPPQEPRSYRRRRAEQSFAAQME